MLPPTELVALAGTAEELMDMASGLPSGTPRELLLDAVDWHWPPPRPGGLELAAPRWEAGSKANPGPGQPLREDPRGATGHKRAAPPRARCAGRAAANAETPRVPPERKR
jgi:hypothetical protein